MSEEEETYRHFAEEIGNGAYDPHQDKDERRILRKEYRQLIADMEGIRHCMALSRQRII